MYSCLIIGVGVLARQSLEIHSLEEFKFVIEETFEFRLIANFGYQVLAVTNFQCFDDSTVSPIACRLPNHLTKAEQAAFPFYLWHLLRGAAPQI
jgi:hypothetical protein